MVMDPEDPTGPEDEWGQWRPVEGGPPMAPPPSTAPMPPVPPTMPPGPPTLGWTQTVPPPPPPGSVFPPPVAPPPSQRGPSGATIAAVMAIVVAVSFVGGIAIGTARLH